MTIAKCKKCGGGIMTPEHLDDKKDLLCAGCVLKEFDEIKSGIYLSCKKCKKMIYPNLNDTNKHLRICSHNLNNTKNKGGDTNG